MKIIVGLGNPGEQYHNSRHNAGWIFIDARLGDVKWTENKKFQALAYRDGETLYLKPLTFMNESGISVRKAMDYYGLLPKNFGLINKRGADLSHELIVVHDELDLDFGNYKISVASGSAGHRGVQSIINHLKTKEFTRIRIGIKNELLRTHIPPEKFVLANFSSEEKEKLKSLAKDFNLNTTK